jgi:hypothetical protein
MLEVFRHLPEKIVADAGYGSESNYEMIMDDYGRTALIPYNTYHIQKNMNLDYFKAQAKKQLSVEEHRAIYQQRKVDVETVFGNLKANLAFRRFSLRGRRKVKIEIGLALLAGNLRKFTQMVRTALETDTKNGDPSAYRDESPFFLVFRDLYVPAPFR